MSSLVSVNIARSHVVAAESLRAAAEGESTGHAETPPSAPLQPGGGGGPVAAVGGERSVLGKTAGGIAVAGESLET